MKLRSFNLATVIATIALISVIATTAIAIRVHASGAAHNCQQIELIKQRIRDSIQVSVATLGKPGSPGYAYYHAHPAELAKALANAQVTLLTFAPSKC